MVEANQQVISLLSTYPELANYIESDNGRYTISDEGWTTVLEETKRQVALSQNLAQFASIQSQKASLKSKTTDLSRQNLGDLGAIAYVPKNVSKALIEDILNDSSIERLAGLEDELSYLGSGAEEAAKQIRELANTTKTLKLQEEQYAQSRIDSILQSDEQFNASSYSTGAQKNV